MIGCSTARSRSLPPGETVVGAYAGILFEDEPGIWLPYGQRRVECLLADDPPERFRELGIHYVVVSGLAVKQSPGSLGKWLEKYNASLVDQYIFPSPTRQPSEPPDLYLVHLN